MKEMFNVCLNPLNAWHFNNNNESVGDTSFIVDEGRGGVEIKPSSNSTSNSRKKN